MGAGSLLPQIQEADFAICKGSFHLAGMEEQGKVVLKQKLNLPSPSGEDSSPSTFARAWPSKVSAKTPPNPVPYSSRWSAQGSLDPPGRCVGQVEGRGFTWMQGLPTGWVGQRRQERCSGESSERKKTESTFIHHLAALRGRVDPEMHSLPPTALQL